MNAGEIHFEFHHAENVFGLLHDQIPLLLSFFYDFGFMTTFRSHITRHLSESETMLENDS